MRAKMKKQTALGLMEAAKEACTPPSWYQLARELHTTPSVIVKWRSRDGAFDDEAAWLMAGLLKMDMGQVIAIREASREKNEQRRARWVQRLQCAKRFDRRADPGAG